MTTTQIIARILLAIIVWFLVACWIYEKGGEEWHKEGGESCIPASFIISGIFLALVWSLIYCF